LTKHWQFMSWPRDHLTRQFVLNRPSDWNF
jgi:hypothetical protein